MNQLRVGDEAPNIALVNRDGATIAVSDLWEKQPVILDFLRHFG